MPELVASADEAAQNIIEYSADPHGYANGFGCDFGKVRGWFVWAGDHWAFGPSRAIRYNRDELLDWTENGGAWVQGGTPGDPKKDHLMKWFDLVQVGDGHYSSIFDELTRWLFPAKLNGLAKIFLFRGDETGASLVNSDVAATPNDDDVYELLYQENILVQRTVTHRGRSASVRDLCIDFWKAVCWVCEANFELDYGPAYKGVIEVHHLKPLSSDDEARRINPVKDCRPLCPNCHRLAHHGMPKGKCRSIWELQKMWLQRPD